MSLPTTAVTIGITSATVVLVLNLPRSVIVWNSEALPSAPRTLTATTGDSGISLAWARPTDRHAQIAQYEVLRRGYLPAGLQPYFVIGTTKALSLLDTTARGTGNYEYKVRTVTKQDTRGPDSNVASAMSLRAMTCGTNYGESQTVSNVFTDFDFMAATNTAKDPVILDAWLYASSTPLDLERCTSFDWQRLYVKREIYHQHGLPNNVSDCIRNATDPTPPVGTSCDLVSTTAGAGSVAQVNTPQSRLKTGWSRHPIERVYMFDLEPGVYSMRYQSCVVQPNRNNDICSGWRDSGRVNYRVTGPDFTATGILPSPTYPFPTILD